MSDSEETKPGASSALLNIASAYSDSDSSQENAEDFPPQKSLGSLVENLRAEAKRFEGDAAKGCEEQTRNPPLELEKSPSVTKIVRLDSGKVVKIRTSPGSKVSDFRPEETHFRPAETAEDLDIGIHTSDFLNVPLGESEVKLTTDPVQQEVNANFNISDDSQERIELEENKFDLNLGLNNVGNYSRVINTETFHLHNITEMGIKNTKEMDKKVDEAFMERKIDEVRTENNAETMELPNTWTKGSSDVVDDIIVEQEIKAVNPVPDSSSQQKEKEESAVPEKNTESTILNAYLTSKQSYRTDGNLHKVSPEKNLETPEVMFRMGHFERRETEKSTAAGSVVESNVNTEATAADDGLHGFNMDEGLVSKLDMYDVKPRPELKPVPRLERLTIKSPLESQLKKTEQELQLQASSPTLYKMLESCDAAATPEVRRGPAPIKLKRNFSCISGGGSGLPEKKFIPEPSESARITPSDSEISSDTPALPEIAIHPVEAHPREDETMKSPQGMLIPNVSPTLHSQQESYQPSFSNMINTSPNQVATFQAAKKLSPQQRATRREEQKRTLPLILRKADNSTAKIRVEEGAKTGQKKDDLNSASKMMSEGEISMETISSESQEQSASVPFSNSSSNQENSNFATSVNFENVIGSGTASKEPETPLSEDAGCDNARPPPTPTKEEQEEKQPTSFLSQTGEEPAEMPTIIIPKKRGRPRKFPLPETSPLVGTWPTPDKNGKSTPRSGKRKKPTKKQKPEPDVSAMQDTPKKRLVPRYKKKTKTPGEEPEVTRTFNKKGRMEVMTEGCKPVTVNQITEYYWPPLSTLPPGEKPEGLMIQEQISEYLGVKSFKRKYPSIKRRPADMEERNYLQENGFVSENMCDMGLTAVYSADIMEIMYNDFPHKFEEYRRYTREKKMKEQKALREKQAAENMDPRKEALESVVSWNTEFNNTRKFRIFPLDDDKRNEMMGMVVPPFEKVLVVHAPVNVPLCVETEFWESSLFSSECEISTHCLQNFQKEYSEENKWVFAVGT